MRILVVTACFCLIACPAERPGDDLAGDAGTAADAGAAPVDHGAIAKDAVLDLCRLFYGCFGESRLMGAFMSLGGGPAPSVSACDTEVTESTEAVRHLAAALDAGTVTMDAEAFAQCNPALVCADVLHDGVRGIPCSDAITGTVAEDGACFLDLECAGGGQTHRCSAQGAQCGVCVPLAAEGADCSDGDECLPGLTCGEDENEGVCTPVDALLSAGEACNAEDGPLDGNCDMWEDLICLADEGAEEGRCTEASFDAQEGEFCFLFAGVFCAEGLVCPMTFAPDENNPPTCRQAVAAGENCLEGDGFSFLMTPCVEGYYCSDATRQCEAQKANGAFCEEDGECAEGSCDDDGACAPRPLFGDDGRGDYQLCP